MAEKLINAGAKIDAFGGSSLSTPLHLAASYEDTEMVKMLLEYGADPFKKDGDGNFCFFFDPEAVGRDSEIFENSFLKNGVLES